MASEHETCGVIACSKQATIIDRAYSPVLIYTTLLCADCYSELLEGRTVEPDPRRIQVGYHVTDGMSSYN